LLTSLSASAPEALLFLSAVVWRLAASSAAAFSSAAFFWAFLCLFLSFFSSLAGLS